MVILDQSTTVDAVLMGDYPYIGEKGWYVPIAEMIDLGYLDLVKEEFSRWDMFFHYTFQVTKKGRAKKRRLMLRVSFLDWFLVGILEYLGVIEPKVFTVRRRWIWMR